MNLVSLPVGKQHEITAEISEKIDIEKRNTYKIKITATTFMNTKRWKWMLLATWSNIYNKLSSSNK